MEINSLVTSKGLHAIFDGCPLLESLELCNCGNINLNPLFRHRFGLKLEEELRTRCIDRIKNLWLPRDSTHDYERLATDQLVDKKWDVESMRWEI